MKRALTLLTLLFAVLQGSSQLQFTQVSLTGPSLSQPVDITGSGDGSGRLFVVEKRGTIRIIQNGAVLSNFFLNIQTQVMNSGERGLLGLAFHPDFPDTPYFYVNYVIVNTNTNRISRFTVNPADPNDALENTQLVLLEQAGIESNHKAGDIAFGPDGFLYIGMGDGGGGGDPSNAGQNINTRLGKMLRIDVDSPDPGLNYGIPDDNPFANGPGLDEIWAIGLRNPWRISFDRLNGDLWIADVGQNIWEEVNRVPAGTPGGINFGWDCWEGNHGYDPNQGYCPDTSLLTWPVHEYSHAACNPCPNGRGNSVSGGFVYRGSQHTTLYGYYIMADYTSNYIWAIKPKVSNPSEYHVFVQNGTGMVDDVVTFGEADNGELYAASLGGAFYTVGASGPLPVQWGLLRVSRVNRENRIDWTMFDGDYVERFEVQRSPGPAFDSYKVVGDLLPAPDKIHYHVMDPELFAATMYYRVGAVMRDGEVEYSPLAWISETDVPAQPSIVLDPVTGAWSAQLPDGWRNGDLTLYDLQGKEVWARRLTGTDRLDLEVPAIPGSYYVKITGPLGTWSGQVVR